MAGQVEARAHPVEATGSLNSLCPLQMTCVFDHPHSHLALVVDDEAHQHTGSRDGGPHHRNIDDPVELGAATRCSADDEKEIGTADATLPAGHMHAMECENSKDHMCLASTARNDLQEVGGMSKYPRQAVPVLRCTHCVYQLHFSRVRLVEEALCDAAHKTGPFEARDLAFQTILIDTSHPAFEVHEYIPPAHFARPHQACMELGMKMTPWGSLQAGSAEWVVPLAISC